MSKSIDKIVQQAKPVKQIENKPLVLPPIQCNVQKTAEHARLLGMSSCTDLGFTIIDPSAFHLVKMSLRLGIKVPVFGFFSVDEAPFIEGEARCGFDNRGPSFKWTHNTLQPVEINSNDAFGFFERLWYEHSAIVAQIFLWCITVAILGVGYAFLCDHSRVDAVGMIMMTLTIASLPLGAGISGILAITKVRRTGVKKFRTTLEHIIPEEVVVLIKEHKNKFNKGMYIVADVTKQWKMSTESRWSFKCASDVDPLLIGVHNTQGMDHYHLVHKFDLLPTERYVVGLKVKR